MLRQIITYFEFFLEIFDIVLLNILLKDNYSRYPETFLEYTERTDLIS